MNRRTFYAWLGLAFVLGLATIVALPGETLTILSIGVPASILAAIVSVIYLVRVYRAQPVPRSRFFGMLIELFSVLLLIGGWVGYLTIARLTERAFGIGALDWFLPAPSPAVSAPISALVVIVVFASPVRFALEVWRARRRADSGARSLDREPPRSA